MQNMKQVDVYYMYKDDSKLEGTMILTKEAWARHVKRAQNRRIDEPSNIKGIDYITISKHNTIEFVYK